jgi:tripartite-type tricarboxylate transporter receptor subunit TctC
MRRILSAGLLGVLSVSLSCLAQDYPSRRITLLVGYSAGGPVDVSARLLAERLRERLKQPVIVENRIGGGPQLSFESTKNAAPDGYTLAIATPGLVTLKLTSLAYTLDPLKDFSHIAHLIGNIYHQMLIGSTAAPYRTLQEFVAYARANPGKISFGTAGTSLEMEIGRMASIGNFKVTLIPYKGSAPQQLALAAGEIGAALDGYGVAKPNIDAGKARVLGVGSRERVAELPGVPSISEVLPGYEVFTNWFGLIGPANMPPELVARINESVGEVLREPDMPARLAPMGLKPVPPSSPQAFRALVAADVENYSKAAALIGLRPQ